MNFNKLIIKDNLILFENEYPLVLNLPNSLVLAVNNDTVSILIQFENGSTGVIAYFSNGSKELSKEYFEVFSAGTTCIIDDFKELKIYSKGKPFKKKLFNQNKGQKEMVEQYINNLLANKGALISMEEIYAVTKTTFKIIESINCGGKQIDI